MVGTDELRALALGLPEVTGGAGESGHFSYEVGGKGIAWAYLARATPKAKRVPVPGVVAIRCPLESKELLLEVAPEKFFTDDHYRGYPAVLVRLDAIEADELEGLLRQAWKVAAPKAIARKYEV